MESPMKIKNLTIIAAGLAMLMGCGLEEDPQDYVGQTPKSPPVWTNEKPLVQMSSPGDLAVGQTLTIFGQRFVPTQHGKVFLHFKGHYFDSKGSSHVVELQKQAKVLNAGKLTWNLWPNIVFHPNGDQLGRFVGHLRVMNQGNDGSLLYSEPLPVSINIKPSLIPRVARPINSGCSSVVGDTLENQAMAFAVEAVGLRAGTKDSPLTFYWTFLGKHWKVSYNYGTGSNGKVPEQQTVVIEHRVTSGTTSTVSDSGPTNFLVKVGSDLLGTARLKELKTGAIPTSGNKMPISANVVAVDSSGKSVRLAIDLNIHRKAEMSYDNSYKLAERFPPVRVTGCIPGQDIGRDVTYHESYSESRSRSVGFNWNVGVGGNVAPIPSNPFALGINFSVGFGVNINEHVSSDKQKSLSISGHILPGEYGTFYRQTTKIHRVAKIHVNTVCGQSYYMGNAILSDWIFTPDLATGATCPPPSKLPKPQKFY